MKKDWERFYEDDVPPALRKKLIETAERELVGRRSRFQFSWRLLLPASGLALAAAVAAIIVLQPGKQAPSPGLMGLSHDPEMVLDAEMFSELKLLEKYGSLLKDEKRKWPKKKS